MKILRLPVALAALLLFGACPASASGPAADRYVPIPKSAPLAGALAIDGPTRDLLVKARDLAVASPEFKSLAEGFARDAKVPFPIGLLDYVRKVTALKFAIFPYEGKAKRETDVLVAIGFDSAKTAEEFYAAFKAKALEIAKAGGDGEPIAETVADGAKRLTIATPSAIGKGDLMFLVAGNSFCVVTQCEGGGSLQAVLDAREPKACIASADKFKAFAEKAGADPSLLLFFDTSALKADGDPKMAETAETIRYLGLGLGFADDLSRMTATAVLSPDTDQLKDKQAALGIKILAALLGGARKSGQPGAILPADVIGLLDVRLNLSKEIFLIPELAEVRDGAAQLGVNLEDELLSWFDGEIFLAVGDYPATDPKGKPGIPEVYVGLHSTDMAKADPFFARIADTIRSVDSSEVTIGDESIGGQAVRSIRWVTPAQDLSMRFGRVGDFLVLASTRAAFEKSLRTQAKRETSLAATKEFPGLMAALAPSAITHYANTEKSLASASGLFPALKTVPPGLLQSMALSLGMSGNDLLLSAVVTTDPTRFDPARMFGEIVKWKALLGPRTAPGPESKDAGPTDAPKPE